MAKVLDYYTPQPPTRPRPQWAGVLSFAAVATAYFLLMYQKDLLGSSDVPMFLVLLVASFVLAIGAAVRIAVMIRRTKSVSVGLVFCAIAVAAATAAIISTCYSMTHHPLRTAIRRWWQGQ